MKREILFKAKISGTSTWIEGLPYSVYKENEIDSIKTLQGERIIDYIDIDTLSQFINQKDKNGKKIFEGDYDADGNCVVWCENCNGFEFAAIDVPTKDICIPCHRCDGNFFFGDQINDFEIVGNVAD